MDKTRSRGRKTSPYRGRQHVCGVEPHAHAQTHAYTHTHKHTHTHKATTTKQPGTRRPCCWRIVNKHVRNTHPRTDTNHPEATWYTEAVLLQDRQQDTRETQEK